MKGQYVPLVIARVTELLIARAPLRKGICACDYC